MTRVPPVTALRSPPLSRTTGALSPVMALSSTEATPSITSPSAGIDLARLDDHHVADLQVGGGNVHSSDRAACSVDDPMGRRRACRRLPQRLPPGPCRAFGDRFGEVGEQHGEPQPDGSRRG